METILIISIALSFFIVLFGIPMWIRKAKQIGLMWEDMHKKGKPKNVAGSGGLVVLFGFVLSVLAYVALKTFVLKTDITTLDIFALLMGVFIAGIIGFIDDIFGWKYGGLSVKSRLFLLFFASIPLIVINAGESRIIGTEIGLFYPLIFIPVWIIGASSTFNFLAGYNGLEASQGIILLSAVSVITFITNNSWLTMICLYMIACLIAFYIFNRNPAKVFPGDVMTYAVGALIAIVAILGNFEKIVFFFFIPYILETILKLRGKLKKESFAKVNEDGSLDVPYGKIYGLEHLAIRILKKIRPNKKVYEKSVVYLINGFQILIIIIGFLIFRKGIFGIF